MKTIILSLGLTATLLLPGFIHAEDVQPGPPPERPRPANQREEWRQMPPEERWARMRQPNEQPMPDFAPDDRPVANRLRNPNGMMPPAGAGRVLMVLTPEQRESIRDEFEQNRDKIRELEQELREARKAAADAGLAKDFNEEELRKKLEAAAKLEIEMTLLRARALSKIEPPLSDEQIERIKNPPAPGEMMRERRQEQARPNPPAARPPSDQPIPRVPRDGQRPPQQF